MERKTEIKQAYKSLGRAHSLYDNMMLGTNAAGRLILKALLAGGLGLLCILAVRLASPVRWISSTCSHTYIISYISII